MPTRRKFLTTSSLAGVAALLPAASFSLYPAAAQSSAFVSRRPPLAQRKFVSAAVEQTIAAVAAVIAAAELAGMFENCFPNTLDTTVAFRQQNGKPDTFVLTSDIPAMWLRDSTAQVWPYLPLAAQDDALRALLAGVTNRQTQCLLIAPYANAFNDGPADSPWHNDLTDMKPELHERKWEIDSLCYPLRLAHGFWQTTGETARRLMKPGGAPWLWWCARSKHSNAGTAPDLTNSSGAHRLRRIPYRWAATATPAGPTA